MRRGYHDGECDDVAMCHACAEKERVMQQRETSREELKEPLKGIEVKMFCPSWGALRDALVYLCRMRALVCTSPNRTERCDHPATRIFWQDAAESYPCCMYHLPEGPQWTGNTKWNGGHVRFHLFAERMHGLDWPREIQSEAYDRTLAV